MRPSEGKRTAGSSGSRAGNPSSPADPWRCTSGCRRTLPSSGAGKLSAASRHQHLFCCKGPTYTEALMFCLGAALRILRPVPPRPDDGLKQMRIRSRHHKQPRRGNRVQISPVMSRPRAHARKARNKHSVCSLRVPPQLFWTGSRFSSVWFLCAQWWLRRWREYVNMSEGVFAFLQKPCAEPVL